MHQMWSGQCWIFGLRGNFIADCKEIPIQQPVNQAAQRAAWSSSKNRSTIKYEVGASPSGFISYCPDAYAGSTSDRQIVGRSELYQKCEKGVCKSIMADQEYNAEDLFTQKVLCTQRL